MGFDVAEGALPDCPKCGAVWSPAATESSGAGSGFPLGNVVLSAAALICVTGCAGAVVKTVYGLVTLQQVFSIITVSPQTAGAMRVLIVLDGAVWFVLCAALTIVFVRVQQLR